MNGDPGADKVVTLKAYYKLCKNPDHRAIILKDQVFVSMLQSLLFDDSSDVLRYVVKILLLLTEKPEHVLLFSKACLEIKNILQQATEKITNPSVNYNLVVITSRFNALEGPRASVLNKDAAQDSLTHRVNEADKGRQGRQFMGKKSKQLVFEFDSEEFNETQKREVERTLLKKKGTISVYLTDAYEHPRAVLRVVPTVDAKEVAELLFSIGCEYVVHIVKVEGKEEKFEMYASDFQDVKAKLDVPDYLDDELAENFDPSSCVITNDQAQQQKQTGGWFNSISSLVRGSLW